MWLTGAIQAGTYVPLQCVFTVLVTMLDDKYPSKTSSCQEPVAMRCTSEVHVFLFDSRHWTQTIQRKQLILKYKMFCLTFLAAKVTQMPPIPCPIMSFLAEWLSGESKLTCD